ncbi:hypothetical protein MAPG_04557 [Magnaporthiopsis poae ATCC 64411]|uniref:SET domain-containing protein n=1 Tax=Magnaporthiopsis poae (strain ATCC 64411 / 73-15) TaxID=644358 RepID=A0A0C4DX21_MAGP6|nr:hypothetical protein MAPG_04557 [Magnaporthiopsis poae ATCC 64411]
MPAVAKSHESTMTSHIEIREIPNKGKGVVAVASIPLGTRVLCEEPLLVCQCLPDKAILNSLVADKLEQMPLERQREFLSLHNKDAGGPYPLAGIFDTNSIPLGDAGSGAVYPTVCRLNHSCRPNCMTSWNTTLRRQTVHATRRIEEGEELTARLVAEGEDSPNTAKMLRVAVDPCVELGISEEDSRDWASPVSLVPPEEYPPELYEAWLWRQGTEGDGFGVDRYLRGRM